MECSICLSTIEKDEESFIAKCNHHFHRACYRDWHFRNNSCPNCRATIVDSSFITATQFSTALIDFVFYSLEKQGHNPAYVRQLINDGKHEEFASLLGI